MATAFLGLEGQELRLSLEYHHTEARQVIEWELCLFVNIFNGWKPEAGV